MSIKRRLTVFLNNRGEVLHLGTKETGGDVFVSGCVAAPSPYMYTLSECHKIFISDDTTAINVDNFEPFKLLHFLSTVV